MIKRLENDKATLLEKPIQNAPNNLYVKNSRKLHKNRFPKSIFSYNPITCAHSIFLVFTIFFLEEKYSLLFLSLQNKCYQSQLTGILGFRSTKAPIYARVSATLKNTFAQFRKKV